MRDNFVFDTFPSFLWTEIASAIPEWSIKSLLRGVKWHCLPKMAQFDQKRTNFLEWDECLKWAFGLVTVRWLLLRRMEQTLSKTDYIAGYVDIIRGLIMCNDLKGTAHSAQDKFWGFTFFKAYISFWYRKKHMLNAWNRRWWGRWRFWHSGQNWYFGHTCKKREIPEICLRNFFWIFRKILGWEREINTAPKPSPEVAPSKMEVAPS